MGVRRGVRGVTVGSALLAGLAACEAASDAQGGNPDAQRGTPEKGQGTIIEDTLPHRPGSPDPSQPATGGG